MRWSFIAHVRRKDTEALTAKTKLWLQKRVDKRNARHERFYTSLRRKEIDHTLAKTSKTLTERFLQLKTSHAMIDIYLYRIKIVEDESCEWCRTSRQSVSHVLLKCRKWRRKRDVLRVALAKVNIIWSIRSEKKWLANLMRTKKAVTSLLEYLKCTKMRRREEATKDDKTWGKRRDRERKKKV